MTLTGKEIRVLLGANTLFLHIPFTRFSKRSLPASEEQILERMYQELFEGAEQMTGWSDMDSWLETVAKRQAVSLHKEFSQDERTLLIEILAACIEESQSNDDLNVYFGGDEYGIVIEDFKNLLSRLQDEIDLSAS